MYDTSFESSCTHLSDTHNKYVNFLISIHLICINVNFFRNFNKINLRSFFLKSYSSWNWDFYYFISLPNYLDMCTTNLGWIEKKLWILQVIYDNITTFSFEPKMTDYGMRSLYWSYFFYHFSVNFIKMKIYVHVHCFIILVFFIVNIIIIIITIKCHLYMLHAGHWCS